MRVAVVGASAFAKHFVDEFPKVGHEVVLLTRSHKGFFDGKPGLLELRVTDYSSVEQLATLLHDCDAVVCTVNDQSQDFVDVHLRLIEACKRAPKCKRFIPSEFGANSEEYPEQPGSAYFCNVAIKDALRAQNKLEWTVVSNGWLADYLVPSANRYHVDNGPLFPLDLATKTMIIPGTGHDKFTITSARDVATAVAHLLNSDKPWRPFTYVQGEETTWLQVAEVMRTTGGLGDDLQIVHESIDELKAVLEAANESAEAKTIAEFKLYVPTGKLRFDQAKVQRDRDEFFPAVHFRTIKELVGTLQVGSTMVI